VTSVDRALYTRGAAARELILNRELDPAVALSYVVWPSRKLAEASASITRRVYGEDVRRRALELVDAGYSWSAAGREVGVHKATVGDWVRRAAVAGNGDGFETTPGPHQHSV
jgi:hypothetical protein